MRLVVIAYLFMLVAWPVSLVATHTFEGGLDNLRGVLEDPDTVHALRLTVTVAVVAVVINTVFGVGVSLLLVRYEFPGKRLFSALVDLPLSVSPIVVGLSLVLVYGGRGGWLGPTLQDAGFQVIFATPGIVLATIFVTFPFVARELIPLMQSQGNDEEYAALTLGANGWQTFWRVTLPNIRWALLYGVILTNARAVGEFGAVSVVSGSIRGQTNTLSLHIELLAQDHNAVGAFVSASLLAFLALLTLMVKSFIQWRERRMMSLAATLPSANETGRNKQSTL